ncbi:Fe-S cluster assembly protein SufD [Paenibacillus spiritus]|uniref:Fe-S cluster assembly protein SufD n=1 Tax=Paenibacillus spiritus TaxID=2496557 RepID=A0A5J5FZE4_9BACL|nr:MULTISPECIES: Fe-S cluster assembly protein SufD [Paenibacillus]KAA8999681.1 Fe-S cluster assembly protein SufD [Paenibacillus spiritus]
MTTQTILPVEAGTLGEWSVRSGEPDWLTESRLKALELAAGLELPKLEKTRIDRWNIQQYGKNQESVRIGQLADAPESIRSLIEGAGEGNLLIQHNSGVVYAKLAPGLEEQGVVFTDLQTAAKEHGELVRRYLGKAVAADESSVAALHAALWNGGVFLYVPKNVVIDAPIQAVYLTDDAESAFVPHVLIVAERGSALTYVDNYVSAKTEAGLHNGAAEVFVGAGAQVRFASVHQFGADTTDITYRRAVVDNDGSIEWIIGEMNDGDTVGDTKSLLQGNGSTSNAMIIAVGSGSQRLNYSCRAQHFGKNTPSDMITRAVMRENASSIINSITKIEKGATRADGQQTAKVLMLSPKARGDANPILLIDEDDVSAGHAASVGQVNPEQIYYLMSRGISRSDAEKLIIYGFLAPVVSQIPLEGLRDQLQSLVERKLGQ